QRRGRDIVTVKVVVAVAAKGEPVPQVVVDKFSLRSFTDVAREEAEGDVIALGERCHEICRAWQQESLMGDECSLKPTQIADAKSVPIFGGFRDAMQAKQLHGDGPIAAAGKHYLANDFGDAEVFGQRLRERLLASAAGEEEGAIDIEQADVHEGLSV